jgi:hypothetical protein
MSVKIEINLPQTFGRWTNLLAENFGISHLLLIVFALHMLQIGFPTDGYVFDEAHYVPAAIATLKGIGVNPEHPPLVKIIGAIAIGLGGNNWFTWRFPIVLFNIGAIYLIYLIASRFLPRRWALASAAFYAFDVLSFLHGGLFLLDMPAIFFSLLGVYLYLRKQLKYSAFIFGVALLCREMAAFYILTTGIFAVLIGTRVLEEKGQLKRPLEKLASWKHVKEAILFVLIIGTVTFTGFWIYDANFKPATGVSQTIIVNQNVIMNGTTPITTIVTTTTKTEAIGLVDNPIKHLDFWLHHYIIGGGAFSPLKDYQPWYDAYNWILPVEPFHAPIYYSLVRTASSPSGVESKPLIEYTSIGTLPVWYSVWLITPVAIITLLRRKDVKGFGFLTLTLFWLNYVPFILTAAIQHEQGFNYYFIYSVPALALAIPYAWSQLPISNEMRRICIVTHLAICILFFLWYFPVKVLNF